MLLPEELLCGGPFIELRGQREVCIQGCKKVLLCREDEVRLLLRGIVLVICGKVLRCETYYAGAVSIKGSIKSVSFSDVDD